MLTSAFMTRKRSVRVPVNRLPGVPGLLPHLWRAGRQAGLFRPLGLQHCGGQGPAHPLQQPLHHPLASALPGERRPGIMASL
jgi:hypothetical protein